MSHTANKNSPLNLASPQVPQAHNKGIGLAAAAHLTVHVAPYSGMDEGDLVELLWGGCYVTSKTVSATDVGRPLCLRVPESFLRNGKVRVSYRVMKVGGVPETAPHSTFRVKLDLPGGQLIDPDAEENQGLEPLILPASVTSQGLHPDHLLNGLQLTIAPYMNMAAGDEITLRWGDLRMDLAALNGEDIGLPVTFTVPPAFIREACLEGAQEMTYCIIDRAGNNSRWSPARIVSTDAIIYDAI